MDLQLSTFVFEPLRWIDRYGWRRTVKHERLASFYYWREVGRRMNIRAIPSDLAAFERYNIEYERQHVRFCETNRRVGSATRDMFLGWFVPAPLRVLGAPAMYALMDEPLLAAFGFPTPSPRLRYLVQNALKTRSRIARLLPERRRPRLRTAMPRRSYPRGYRIEELGPPDTQSYAPTPPSERAHEHRL